MSEEYELTGEGELTAGDDVGLEGAGVSSEEVDDLETIKARVREMEEEAEKLKQIQCEVDKQMTATGATSPGSTSAAGANSALNLSVEEKMEVDAR